MSKKLGYTFYPKDWQTSDAVFELNLSERGFYRELIDSAMLNDNNTEIKIDVWSRKYNVSIEELETIINKLINLKLVVLKSNYFFIPSCEKRIEKINKNRDNGQKGGRPITQIEPNTKGKEKENRNESEINNTPEIFFKNFMVTDLIIKNFVDKSQLISHWANSANKTFDDAKKLLLEFLEEKKIIQTPYKDIEDLKSHITNWFKNGNLTAKNKTEEKPKPKIYESPYKRNELPR